MWFWAEKLSIILHSTAALAQLRALGSHADSSAATPGVAPVAAKKATGPVASVTDCCICTQRLENASILCAHTLSLQVCIPLQFVKRCSSRPARMSP